MTNSLILSAILSCVVMDNLFQKLLVRRFAIAKLLR